MDVFFETNSGDKFQIELSYWDTVKVLEIKEKIEKYQRIPVSKQTLFFKGNVLEDHLNIEQCKILHNSRIQIVVDTDPNPNHNNDQVLQPEGTPPSNPTEQINNSLQDLTLRPRNQYDVLQAEQSSPSTSVKDIVNIQDSSVKVGSNEKVPKQRMSVRVKPYCGEYKVWNNIMVDVNTTDQVKVLRNELLQRQQICHISLPQDGHYFLVHKGEKLSEDQSFEGNGVAHNDTVEIIPDPWFC